MSLTDGPQFIVSPDGKALDLSMSDFTSGKPKLPSQFYCRIGAHHFSNSPILSVPRGQEPAGTFVISPTFSCVIEWIKSSGSSKPRKMGQGSLCRRNTTTHTLD